MSEMFAAKLQQIVDRGGLEHRADRERDIASLRAHGVHSLTDLCALVLNEQADVHLRSAACWAIGQLGDKRMTGALLHLVQHEHGPLMHQAAVALAVLGSKRVQQPLIALLRRRDDPERQRAAAYALWFCGDGRAVRPLIELLCDERGNEAARGQAAETLGQLLEYGQTSERDDAVAALLAALRDSSAAVRFWSVFALGTLRAEVAIPELERLAATDHEVVSGWWSVAKEAADALSFIRNPDGGWPDNEFPPSDEKSGT